MLAVCESVAWALGLNAPAGKVKLLLSENPLKSNLIVSKKIATLIFYMA
jgi:hypothetical protein